MPDAPAASRTARPSSVTSVPDTVRLVLHAGAKASPDLRAVIEDPDGLLEWLGKERAIVSFAGAADVEQNRRALQAVLKQWLQQLPGEAKA